MNKLPIIHQGLTNYQILNSNLASSTEGSKLFRKLLTWIGFLPPLPEKPFELDSNSSASEPRLRPIFLSRISLSDIWRPATRKSSRNNIWKTLKTSFSILLSQSVLQEPAFQELILLYTTETSDRKPKDKDEVPALQLKIYERIPIPDLPVVFPHKKLSFRIIDTKGDVDVDYWHGWIS
uniref:Uncharacterized protein n=1 Tax=Salix viminalis TaxID=40686 RepID=A0A6N2L7Y7_SALVM